MTSVDYVHSRPGGRVQLSFTPQHVAVSTSPTRWRDWVRRFWWSVLGALALAWIGTLVHWSGAPREVAIALAAPGGVLFACLLIYALIALVVAIFTAGVGEPSMSWLGRWVNRNATPAQPLGVIPVGAVAHVRTERQFRRTTAHVTFTDGRTVRYTRWGFRHVAKPMVEGFHSMTTAPHQR